MNKLETKFDGIIGGFCLPYLSPDESNELISNSYDLLNDDGLLYLSFVEGDPGKSGFKTGNSGRVYFYFHSLDDIKAQLNKSMFGEIKVFKVEYKISETEHDIHTIVFAKKKLL